MERRAFTLAAVITTLSFLFSFVFIRLLTQQKDEIRNETNIPTPKRVVAISPGIAEIVLALGGDKQLVGITEHTRYPPGIEKRKPSIGGFLSPSMERIVALNPDLVIMRREQPALASQLKNIGIRVLRVPDSSVKDVIESIEYIGKAIEKTNQAKKLVANIRTRLEKIRNHIELRSKKGNTAKVKALFIVGRTDNTLRSIYGAASGTLPHSILEEAGGINILEKSLARYPVISKESIISSAPEVIFEVVTPPSTLSPSKIRESWRNIQDVPAIKNGRVHVLTSDIPLIPGPRIIDAVEKIFQLL